MPWKIYYHKNGKKAVKKSELYIFYTCITDTCIWMIHNGSVSSSRLREREVLFGSEACIRQIREKNIPETAADDLPEQHFFVSLFWSGRPFLTPPPANRQWERQKCIFKLTMNFNFHINSKKSLSRITFVRLAKNSKRNTWTPPENRFGKSG